MQGVLTRCQGQACIVPGRPSWRYAAPCRLLQRQLAALPPRSSTQCSLPPSLADSATYFAWRRGLAHLLLLIMAPGSLLNERKLGGVDSGHKPSGPGVVGRTTSKDMLSAAEAALAEVDAEAGDAGSRAGSPAGAGGAPGTPGRGSILAEMRSLSVLRTLGVRVQEMGWRVAGKRRKSSLRGSFERVPRRGSESEASGGLSGDSEEHPDAAGTPLSSAAQQRQQQADSLQLAKRQRMAAYLQTLAAGTHPFMAMPPAARAAARLPRLRVPTDNDSAPLPAPAPLAAPKGRPRMVSVGVQTDESALQPGAGPAFKVAAEYGAAAGAMPGGPPPSYLSSRRIMPGTPGAAPASAAGTTSGGPASAATASDADGGIAAQYLAAMQAAAAEGGAGGMHAPGLAPAQEQQGMQATGSGDADVAAQYMAAMQAAAAGAAWPAPAAEQQQQQHDAQIREPEGSADAGIAAQYLAAMGAAAAAAGGAGAAPAAPPQQQPDAGSPEAGSDADIAAQYMSAMAAAAAAGTAAAAGAEPAAALQEQQGQATPAAQMPRFSGSRRPSYRGPSPDASPLEQLAWQQQQQQRSLHRSRSAAHQQLPASPLDQLALQRVVSARAISTPGSATPMVSPSAAPGGSGGLACCAICMRRPSRGVGCADGCSRAGPLSAYHLLPVRAPQ